MSEHLTIVVPYRDRAQHLGAFVPHMCAYFSRDLMASRLDVEILIVEQAPGGMFNRGMLKNIGFLLAEQRTGFFAFHDIDYLPMWADYSPIESPACIVWYGAEYRPIHPSSKKLVRTNLDETFGCAVLMPAHHFRQVNGYATAYWGWGFEDSDLKNRFRAAGIPVGRRKGTFQPLDHASEGYKPDGKPSEQHLATKRIYDARWAKGAVAGPQTAMDVDGLSSTLYTVVKQRRLPPPETAEREIPVHLVTAAFPTP